MTAGYTMKSKSCWYAIFQAHFYTGRKTHYVEKLKAMIEYADNQQFCRSQLLLSYFGENDSETCGTCDVCRLRAKEQATRSEA